MGHKYSLKVIVELFQCYENVPSTNRVSTLLGADSVRPQVEGVLSSGLQFAAKKAQEEDMLRLVYIEAKIFKNKFAEVLKDKFPTDQVLLEQMWTNGRRDLHDRIKKPLPISNLMEMLWDCSPNLDYYKDYK